MKTSKLGPSSLMPHTQCSALRARHRFCPRNPQPSAYGTSRSFSNSKVALITTSAKYKEYTNIASVDLDFEELNIRNPRDRRTRLPLTIRADAAAQRLRKGHPLRPGDEDILQAAQEQAMSQGIAAIQGGSTYDTSSAFQRPRDKPKFVRVVPAEPAYYTGVPMYTMEMLRARELWRKFKTLPQSPKGTERKLEWVPPNKFNDLYQEVVTPGAFTRLTRVLGRLNRIAPGARPAAVEEIIQRWSVISPDPRQPARVPIPDKFGRTRANGGRKTANASATLVQGTGECYVNGKTVSDFFGRVHDRETVVWALKWTNRLHKYNVWAEVQGGGTTGQAEALAQAVGKSLIGQEPLLKKWVRKVGCLSRDRRMVERKKPGHVKARKMPTWVKR